MPFEVKLKELDPQPVLSVRTKCKAAEIGPILYEILPEIIKLLEKRGAAPSGPPFTRFHGHVGADVEFECGFPVSGFDRGEGRIEAGELPGGTVVTTVHTGPYEDLPKAHDALHRWMQENGKEPADLQWERYLTDPGAGQETELVWPVK